jgi:hypothetical protein
MNQLDQSTEKTRPETSDTQEVVLAFARVGAAWARYGLGVARMGVETGAEALNLTATALGTLADRFRHLEQSPDDSERVDPAA